MGLSAQHIRAWRAILAFHADTAARVQAALAARGLPPLEWYDVLFALYEAPGRRLRMSDVADTLTISRSTFSRLARRLEAAGLLRIEVHATDGRGRVAVLTAAGARMLRRMWPVYETALEQTLAQRLTPAAAREVARLLDEGRRLSRAKPA